MAEENEFLSKKMLAGIVALAASAAGSGFALGHDEKTISVIAILCAGIGALSTVVLVLWKKLESITDQARGDAVTASKADQALADALLALTESHAALAQAILANFRPKAGGRIDN